METARLVAAGLLACLGFYLFVTGALVLTRRFVLRWAAGLPGQHQGGGLREHTEGL